MKNQEKHSTVQGMRTDALIIFCICFISAVIAGSFFVTDEINYGLLVSLITLVSGIMLVIIAVKIHSRHVQELLLKINGKTWEEYCLCDYCLSQRNSKSVNEK